jgi:O-antigen/teichoic acid export membrane protein
MRFKSRALRAGLTGFTTLLSKGITSFVGIVSIPITAHYLGNERFALWLILSSFLSWSSIMDLGLANSLTNLLAAANSKSDKLSAQRTVSNTFYLLVTLAVITSILFIVTFPVIPWQRVINVNSGVAIADIPTAVIATMLLIVLRLVLTIPRQIFGAYQEGYLYQGWSALGNFIAIVGLWEAINNQGNSATLIAALFGLPLLGDLGATIHLFGWRRPWLKPTLNQVKWSESKALLNTGFQLWITQISGIIIFQSEIIIATQLFGSETLATYGVVLKLFASIVLIQSAFVTPLWPAYCEALSTGDIRWVEESFKKSIFASLLWTLSMGITLVLLTPSILSNWLGQHSSLGSLAIIAIFFKTVLMSIDQCLAALGNGLGLFKVESIFAPIFAISSIFLSLYLAQAIGISGISWAISICICIFSFLFYGNFCYKELKIIKKR